MSLSVFLCHASGDKGKVRELYESLQNDGFDPWLDEESLLPGQDWEQEIAKAVRGSDVVCACLSPHSVTKTGYVQKEIKIALDVADLQPEGAIYIIPVKLEECEVPERLSTWHWVNLEDAGGYDRLVAALRRRADDLGLTVANSDESISNDLYDEDETLEADTHIRFPCELESQDQINIDLRADRSVDLLIMDEGDYAKWDATGEVDTLYKEYLHRDQLHTFFKAEDSDTYLVVVRNNSNRSVGISLKIRYLD
jgi:hypothetical protein